MLDPKSGAKLLCFSRLGEDISDWLYVSKFSKARWIGIISREIVDGFKINFVSTHWNQTLPFHLSWLQSLYFQPKLWKFILYNESANKENTSWSTLPGLQLDGLFPSSKYILCCRSSQNYWAYVYWYF